MTSTDEPRAHSRGPVGWLKRHALYPNLYAWYVLASSLDIMLTHMILSRFGGWEVNILADKLLQKYGLWGLIGLKYATVLVVVAVCEIIGRHSQGTGRRLAITAIAISSMPVGIGLLQVAIWFDPSLVPHHQLPPP